MNLDDSFSDDYNYSKIFLEIEKYLDYLNSKKLHKEECSYLNLFIDIIKDMKSSNDEKLNDIKTKFIQR
jgi:hypothetical protein